jgi:hypothetical protein
MFKQIYIIIKITIYTLGLCLTSYSILTDGIVDSHTPPTGFIISFLIILLASVFILIDFLLKKHLKNHSFHTKINII